MNTKCWISVVLFTVVALLSFSVWAFGSRWFGSEPAMYAGCAVVFFGLGGLALLPGSGIARNERLRFCLAFFLAYLAYAFIWSVAWFAIPQSFGEVAGSSLGLLLFVRILMAMLKRKVSLLTATAVLFLFHTLGYYTGGLAYQALQGRGPLGFEWDASPATIRTTARLAWGLFYGIGLAIGIHQVLYLSRQSSTSPSTQI